MKPCQRILIDGSLFLTAALEQANETIRSKSPDVKVLVSSGYTSPEKAPVLEALAVDGFIQKPFEVVKLASTVRDLLDEVAVS
ncbi:MAG: hypothetical protein AUG08_11610 [Acidobacteria bacterium 13_1_20CM_2_55_15]|nr:MAG: hypothetical protein AUG08_11610 [Acidobacteria bacterium 13_1_20CM_2_55_15]